MAKLHSAPGTASLRFTRRSRLLNRTGFRHVFDQPVVSRDRCFSVFSRANDLAYCRLGVAVSRKVSRKATDRNRIKRLVRESFRQHQKDLAEQGGRDIVVLPNARVVTICNSELFESLARHWRKMDNRRPQEPGEQERKKH